MYEVYFLYYSNIPRGSVSDQRLILIRLHSKGDLTGIVTREHD